MASGNRHRNRRRTHSRRPLLSVCMIVKDEEANLDRCLQSLRMAADETIVVDTGSRDRTVEIARRYGARVSRFQWCDDFSAARNAALARANGRWILQMDADDVLAPGAEKTIRSVISIAAPRLWGFFIPCRSHILRDGCEVSTIIHRLLLFRNHPDLRYRRRIHEYVQYTGQDPQPEFQINDDIVIDHHGYAPDQMALKAKTDRNLALLQLCLADDPDDPVNHLYLGQHYFSTRQFGEAVEPLRRAIALCQDPSANYLIDAYAQLVVALCRAGRGGDVPAMVAEAERRVDALTSDFHCNAGEAFKSIGQFERALLHFQRAIDTNHVNKTAKSDPATRAWLPRLGIGIIHESRGQMQLARDAYEEALAFIPQHPTLNHRLAMVAAKLGEYGHALEHIDAVLHLADVPQQMLWDLLQVCEQLADAAATERCDIPNVQKTGGTLAQRIRPRPELGARLAGACGRFGQFEHGIAAASVALEQREDALARVNRGYCYFAMGCYKEAADDFTAALASEPDDPLVLAAIHQASL